MNKIKVLPLIAALAICTFQAQAQTEPEWPSWTAPEPPLPDTMWFNYGWDSTSNGPVPAELAQAQVAPPPLPQGLAPHRRTASSKPNPPPQPAAQPAGISYSQRYASGEWEASTYLATDFHSFSRADAEYGIGFGLDYFATRGFGIGLRAESMDEANGFIDRLGPRLTVRAPLWDRVAPYGYTQALFDLNEDDWHIGTGGGVSVKLTEHVSAFAEAGVDLTLEGRSQLRTGLGAKWSF